VTVINVCVEMEHFFVAYIRSGPNGELILHNRCSQPNDWQICERFNDKEEQIAL